MKCTANVYRSKYSTCSRDAVDTHGGKHFCSMHLRMARERSTQKGGLGHALEAARHWNDMYLYERGITRRLAAELEQVRAKAREWEQIAGQYARQIEELRLSIVAPTRSCPCFTCQELRERSPGGSAP